MGGGQVNLHSFPFRDIMESHIEILKRFKNYASFLINFILLDLSSVTIKYSEIHCYTYFSASLQNTLICMM